MLRYEEWFSEHQCHTQTHSNYRNTYENNFAREGGLTYLASSTQCTVHRHQALGKAGLSKFQMLADVRAIVMTHTMK